MEENEKHPAPEGSIRFSEFSNVRSKCAQTITLEQFVERLRSERFRPAVEEYRRLKSLPGSAAQAQAQVVKNRMPCVVPAGICFGGHAVSDLRQHSRLACIDLDHTADRTASIKQLCRQLPWVVAAFISISGEGVKILVRVRDTDMQQGYAQLYATIGAAVSSHVRHPYDAACRTLTQPCFYSWDPEAYYNPAAEAFILPEAPAGTPLPASASPQTGAPVAGPASLSVSDSAAAATAGADPDRLYRFLRSFDRKHPFVCGHRNEVCLKLGCLARSQFFSQEEVGRLISVYAGRYAVSDFSEKDIRQRVLSGYQHVASSEGEPQTGGRVHQGPGSTYGPYFSEEEGEDEADVSYKNDKLRAEAPFIPNEVYSLLHPFFTRCVKHAADPRERDILLLGSILSCSTLIPHVTFFYKDRLCAPHFYLAVVAPAGTGKGVLSFTNSLLDCTDEHYARQRRQQKKQFDEALLAWDEEQGKARKEHRKPNLDLKPEEQRPQYFKIAANTSKSRLIESLAASGNIGCVMTSTEIITLVSAIKQDYGAFDDILLKAFHHEEVASSFKTDGEPLVARRPCLGVCLSGTQEQFASLFRSLETGLYSRFAFYTRAKAQQWTSCAPDAGGVDLKAYFRTLGEEMLEMHKGLLQSPTYVSFTPAQWEEHTRHFGTLLKKAEAEGRDSAVGIIFRCGLQVMRIAATFTTFRKWDDFRFAKEYTCTDADFRAALLIGDTLLEHSLLLSSSLPESLRKPVAMHRFYRMDETLAALPAHFSYSDFLTTSQKFGISRSSAKRMLKKAIEMKQVDKEGDSYLQQENVPEKGSISGPWTLPLNPKTKKVDESTRFPSPSIHPKKSMNHENERR